MTRRGDRLIEVAATAAAGLRAAAHAALPNETGGILLGWRTASGLHVAQAPEVADPGATKHGYQRNFDAAQSLVTSALAHQSADSPLGYIGEWHSHPAPVAASHADLRWVRRLASDLGGPIGLVVASLSDESWRLSGVLASRFRTHNAVIKDHT